MFFCKAQVQISIFTVFLLEEDGRSPVVASLPALVFHFPFCHNGKNIHQTVLVVISHQKGLQWDKTGEKLDGVNTSGCRECGACGHPYIY